MLEVAAATQGLERIWQNENIAIIVLMVGLIFSGGFNIILLTAFLKNIGKFMAVTAALNSVVNAINILNERLHPKDD